MTWLPKYIRHAVNYRPRQRVDAVDWNALWNLNIQQGDNNTEGIVELMGRMDSVEAMKFSVGSVVEGHEAAVSITGTVPEFEFHFTLPKGPKGDGGIVTDLKPGLFGMYVNSAGHLIVVHNDNEPAPPLSIIDGKLIYTISE